MSTPTRHEVHAAEARKKWGRLTPYRLGLVAGLAGDTQEFQPNPYDKERSRTLYARGVDAGMTERARRAALAHATNSRQPTEGDRHE